TQIFTLSLHDALPISKPLSVPYARDRGRFDSYPLRLTMFDVRRLIFEVRANRASDSKSNLKPQTSKIFRKEVIACRASKFASSRSEEHTSELQSLRHL